MPTELVSRGCAPYWRPRALGPRRKACIKSSFPLEPTGPWSMGTNQAVECEGGGRSFPLSPGSHPNTPHQSLENLKSEGGLDLLLLRLGKIRGEMKSLPPWENLGEVTMETWTSRPGERGASSGRVSGGGGSEPGVERGRVRCRRMIQCVCVSEPRWEPPLLMASFSSYSSPLSSLSPFSGWRGQDRVSGGLRSLLQK